MSHMVVMTQPRLIIDGIFRPQEVRTVPYMVHDRDQQSHQRSVFVALIDKQTQTPWINDNNCFLLLCMKFESRRYSAQNIIGDILEGLLLHYKQYTTPQLCTTLSSRDFARELHLVFLSCIKSSS